MVFQKSNPFPKSIYDNVAYGPRVNGLAKGRRQLGEVVERSFQAAALWMRSRTGLIAARSASQEGNSNASALPVLLPWNLKCC